MSVFVRSTLIFAVALATSASHTIERLREPGHRVLLVGRALVSQDGRVSALTELLVLDIPATDPRAFPSALVTDRRWRDAAKVLVP